MSNSKIERVLDKYFEFIEEIGGGSFPLENIPDSMLNADKLCEFEGCAYWNAIPSTITDAEVQEMESYLRHKLPKTYIHFLKYRHFIELQLGRYSILFFESLPQRFLSDLKNKIDTYYWNLIERNYLPFADFSDFGVLCFDANARAIDNDYPVVLFNHEDGYSESERYAPNFEAMFEEFNQHLDEWIANRRKK